MVSQKQGIRKTSLAKLGQRAAPYFVLRFAKGWFCSCSRFLRHEGWRSRSLCLWAVARNAPPSLQRSVFQKIRTAVRRVAVGL